MERPTGGTPAASALARHCEATGVSLPRCGVVNGQLGIGYCGIMALRNWGITILSPYDFGAAIAACLIPSPAQPGPARPIPLPPHRQAQWRVIAARSASAPYRRSARAHAQRLNPSPAQPGPARPIPLPPHRQSQWRAIAARSASAPYRRCARLGTTHEPRTTSHEPRTTSHGPRATSTWKINTASGYGEVLKRQRTVGWLCPLMSRQRLPRIYTLEKFFFIAPKTKVPGAQNQAPGTYH